LLTPFESALARNSLYGDTFEHFIVAEIRRRFSYSDPDARLAYVRTKDDAEVDLVIERAGEPRFLIEIKSSAQIHEEDLRALSSFASELNANAL
jgi:predicted AAA+ superfamily ATPase